MEKRDYFEKWKRNSFDGKKVKIEIRQFYTSFLKIKNMHKKEKNVEKKCWKL